MFSSQHPLPVLFYIFLYSLCVNLAVGSFLEVGRQYKFVGLQSGVVDKRLSAGSENARHFGFFLLWAGRELVLHIVPDGVEGWLLGVLGAGQVAFDAEGEVVESSGGEGREKGGGGGPGERISRGQVAI